MDQVFIIGSKWLHLLATVLLVGYYALLSLVLLPVFARQLSGGTLGSTVGGMVSRTRWLIFAALGIFVVTGVHLMLADPQYTSIGDFSTPWAAVLLLKHLVVLAMIGLGAYLDVGPLSAVGRADQTAATALHRASWAGRIMLVLGMGVLLLTAVAETV